MRRVLGVFAFVSAVACPTMAQEGTIAKIIFYRAKPGMEQQLEAGLRKHAAWHKEQGGTWGWHVWTYETGEFTGGYATGTLGHSWADFDKPDVSQEKDHANVVETIAPYVAEGAQWRYYELLPSVSRPPDKPAPLTEALAFRLRYGKAGAFEDLQRKFHEAIAKTGWPVHYSWVRLANGGEGPSYVLLIPHESYAGMKGPEKSFGQMLVEAVGARDAQALLDALADTVASETSSIERGRPDLSYVPASR